MKSFTLVLVMLVAATSNSSAQSLIAVQNGGTPAFYTDLNKAVAGATDGDTIFIPAGTWNLGVEGARYLYINKTLHIIGTGHNPAFSRVGGICYLNGGIYLRKGASNGSITGVLISGTLRDYQNYLDEVVNYSITRCKINSTVSLTIGFSQFMFAENIFNGQVYGGNSTNNIFSNNIFTGRVEYFSNNNMFKNNIMMSTTSSTAGNLSLCFFENNIIFAGAKLGAADCIFNNNLFVDNGPFPLGTTNLDFNNIVNQTQSSIFVTQSGNTFNYTQDYHLQSTCPGKNAGKDGTDVGIYGGAFPWKEGSIPFNPHFETFQIAPNTVNGNLNVNIKVAAQEN